MEQDERKMIIEQEIITRAAQVEALSASIKEKEKQIPFIKREITLLESFDVEEFEVFEPKYAYENSPEWKSYAREATIAARKAGLDDMESVLGKEKQGLAEEETKLKLLEQGILPGEESE